MRRIGTIVSMTALALCLAACNGGGSIFPPRPAERVGAITLFSNLSAVNVDEDPATDGVTLEVFFHRERSSETVPVSGTLELAMYEGKLPTDGLAEVEPYHVWRFTGEQLQPFLRQKLGLWCYSMTLRWGDSPPQSGSVTLLARYIPKSGPTVTSKPTRISTGRS